MRLAFTFAALVALAAPAQAGPKAVEKLTENQTRFLHMMAGEMQANLQRQHKKQNQAQVFKDPKVAFDARTRSIIVTQQLRKPVDARVRKQIRRSVEQQGPRLCLALRPRAVRKTQVAIMVRALREDGRKIGSAIASPERCG